MNLVVLLKMVPDTVEELAVAADGKSLDQEWLRFKLSDSDEHALEEALLLKERHGGRVTVVAIDSPELDDALFMALAKGADRAVKLTGDLGEVRSRSVARLFADFIQRDGGGPPPDTLVLLRGQAVDDLEGEVGPYLAAFLRLPFLSVVTAVRPEGGGATVVKEFSGGLRGEFTLPCPAILGIQSAEKPPRYVPIARVRAVMKSAQIESLEVSPQAPASYPVDKLCRPPETGRAEMIEGETGDVADKLLQLLAERSLI
jgi:electron transfer flavoprotein beta subunit